MGKKTSITVRGHVEAVFYSSPLFSAGRLITKSGEKIPFAGRVFVRENDLITLSGRWGNHPIYGRQLNVDSIDLDLAVEPAGLARYLANNPRMKGIGPVRAARIAAKFGNDFERVITQNPEEIAEAASVPSIAADNIRSEWLKTKHLNNSAARLAAFGLSHYQVTTLVKKFGDNISALIEADPYIFINEIPGFGFKRVDKIARKIGAKKEAPSRIRAGLLHCLHESLDRGDCWVDFQELIDQANLLLVMDTMESRILIEKELNGLIDECILSCFSHGGRFLVSDPQIRRMEEDLASWLMRGRNVNQHFKESACLPAMISETAPELNERQREAVISALRYSISLISGGAGSGKTFTISAIARMYEKKGARVILAAPTGKAAKRLEQVAGKEAFTIHRLLGFNGKEYSRGPDNVVKGDAIIIDELSMVDVPLAWRLFRAIDLEKTSLVLVGDHNQLPPIGPGSILRDLVESRAVPTVILDQTVRQAGILKENCMAVLNGNIPRTSEIELSGRRSWYLVDQFTDAGDAQKFLLNLFENILQERLRYDLISDIQLLTPMHKGPLGTRELNIEMQRLIQKKLWGIEVGPTLPGRRPKFLPHDKVIQIRNDHKTGIMNGTIGTVLEVGPNGSLTVDFEGTEAEIQAGSPNLQDIQLAYALTIHKAQGSEFPCAVVVVHKSHSFMHHRNLLYTGVTRARETAILVGDRWGVKNCAGKRKQNERKTFLAMLLSKK